MALARGAKGSIGFLINRLRPAPTQSGHGYSSWAGRNRQLSEVREPSFNYLNDGNSQCGFGRKILLRRFSVEASDQLKLIKQLRERTSAPIKDIKTSLVACDWDIEAAQKDLRKRGVIQASKKSSRTAAEGLLALAQNGDKAAIIELNCETDFVARNEIFQYLALSLARIALSVEKYADQASSGVPFDPEYLEQLRINLDHPKLSGETTVRSAITEVAAIMGENIKLRRGFAVSKSTHGVVYTYMHSSPQPGLGRISGILTLEADNDSVSLDALQRVGSQLAMHIVAAKPVFLSKELVPSEALKAELEIIKSQAEISGRTKMGKEKMVEGRLRKYMEEVAFMEQKFVVDDSKTIKNVMDGLSKEVGSQVKIGKFFRMEVGEGIQRLETSGES
ncbi:hypothetical protein MKW98_031208 [Papaver atlanticum]|uniref:Elongation factor Ts, mitochondrial n=1 Tax=Papaver atlanticum TaxID=357466 RepID=A0AAD4T4Z1_9MAGN|nr:hypothetical protein MKW98_031208 [Papaver atlanticum]